MPTPQEVASAWNQQQANLREKYKSHPSQIGITGDNRPPLVKMREDRIRENRGLEPRIKRDSVVPEPWKEEDKGGATVIQRGGSSQQSDAQQAASQKKGGTDQPIVAPQPMQESGKPAITSKKEAESGLLSLSFDFSPRGEDEEIAELGEVTFGPNLGEMGANKTFA